LSPSQRADLKRKFTRASQLERAERRVASIALDIATHFATNWQGTGFKGMVVTPDKATALNYKKYLDETGLVSSDVVISASDSREGEEDTGDERANAVQRFWQDMMMRYGDEERYNKRIVEDFQHDGAPDLLIVVDKLLVGFDAPLATVLYLARKLQDHALLQAIARVNRVAPGKDAGFIVDYAGVLESLDKALDVYGSLPDFDRDDLVDTVHDVASLPEVVRQRHAALLDQFKAVPANRRHDRETLERFLADEAERHEFYDVLGGFLKALQLAMSSSHFLEQVPRAQLARYRDDAKAYEMLRRAVRHRYQETVDYGAYEGRIQALLDRHVGALEPQVITPLVNIFDAESVKAEVERQSPGSSADAIAHALVREITERMDEDPVFYEKFGKLVKAAIDAYRAKRLEDASFLQQVLHLREQVTQGADSDLPANVREYDPERRALFRKFREVARTVWNADTTALDALSADAAKAIRTIVDRHRTVNWAQNTDVRNRIKNDIEDFLYQTERRSGLALGPEETDELLERALTIAQHHEPR
ncbi:MAG: type I restriction enzyme subunit R domain-containing protein, partial [Gemmatimonadaceae bacterium]